MLMLNNAENTVKKAQPSPWDRILAPFAGDAVDAASGVGCDVGAVVFSGSLVFETVACAVLGSFVSVFAFGIYALPVTLEMTHAAASSLCKSK
jgi:hypothetical protein